MLPESEPVAVAAAEHAVAERPGACRECGYAKAPRSHSGSCPECGASDAWPLDRYALQYESKRVLRSVRRGTGMMLIGWIAFCGLFLVKLAAYAAGMVIETRQAKIANGLAVLAIIGWMMACMPYLFSGFRRRPKTVQVPLFIGCASLAMGLVMAMSSVGVYIVEAIMSYFDPSPAVQFGSLRHVLGAALSPITECAGWSLCGAGCLVVTQSYLRRMRNLAPWPWTMPVVALSALTGAAAIAGLLWQEFGMGPGVNPDSVVRPIHLIWVAGIFLVVVVAMFIAGGLHAWRLWSGLKRLMDAEGTDAEAIPAHS